MEGTRDLVGGVSGDGISDSPPLRATEIPGSPEAPAPRRGSRRGCTGCLVFGLVLFGVFCLIHWWKGPLRYLQFHASEIHDFYDESPGWTGDFSRRISAKCTEETFHDYAAQQGLTTRLNAAAAAAINFRWGAGPRSWWHPPENLTGAYYFYKDGGSRYLLAYDGTRLFYDIEVW
jgi:hypothetical protein